MDRQNENILLPLKDTTPKEIAQPIKSAPISYDDICAIVDTAACEAIQFLRQTINSDYDLEYRLQAARIILSNGGDFIVNRKKLQPAVPFVNDID